MLPNWTKLLPFCIVNKLALKSERYKIKLLLEDEYVVCPYAGVYISAQEKISDKQLIDKFIDYCGEDRRFTFEFFEIWASTKHSPNVKNLRYLLRHSNRIYRTARDTATDIYSIYPTWKPKEPED